MSDVHAYPCSQAHLVVRVLLLSADTGTSAGSPVSILNAQHIQNTGGSHVWLSVSCRGDSSGDSGSDGDFTVTVSFPSMYTYVCSVRICENTSVCNVHGSSYSMSSTILYTGVVLVWCDTRMVWGTFQ